MPSARSRSGIFRLRTANPILAKASSGAGPLVTRFGRGHEAAVGAWLSSLSPRLEQPVGGSPAPPSHEAPTGSETHRTSATAEATSNAPASSGDRVFVWRTATEPGPAAPGWEDLASAAGIRCMGDPS